MKQSEALIPDEIQQRYNAYVKEMLAPDGIESWVRSGRTPWIHKAYGSGVGERYMFHIPPREATTASRLEMDMGGVICYLDENDTEGEGCETIIVSLQDGQRILERIQKMNAPSRTEQLLQKLPQWLRSLGQAMLGTRR